MLGSIMVELSTTLQANSPTSLDVVLQQHQDPVAPLPSSRDATAATSLSQEIILSPQPQATKESTTSATETTEKQEKENEKKRSQEMRNWLLVVATFFANMTYQAGLSPPHERKSSNLSGNFTGITNITTPSVINTTMVQNTSSNINMTTSSYESPDECNKFVIANTIAFVYSMSAIVLLLSDTMCEMLKDRKDLKAIMAINAFIIALAYSMGCENSSYLGPLIAMCVIVLAYVADYLRHKSKIGKDCIVRNCRTWCMKSPQLTVWSLDFCRVGRRMWKH